jgi:hypothetical protein
LSHPTLRILSFCPPSVNDAGEVEVHVVQSRQHVVLSGSRQVLQDLARAILTVRRTAAEPKPALHKRGRKMNPDLQAKYLRVLEAINSGLPAKTAARREGVYSYPFRKWKERRLLREAADAAKTSGQIL